MILIFLFFFLRKKIKIFVNTTKTTLKKKNVSYFKIKQFYLTIYEINHQCKLHDYATMLEFLSSASNVYTQ